MTGLGFARQGQDSLKANRKLLNSKPTMKENLLPSSKDTSYKESLNDYDELIQYNLAHQRNKRKTRRIVYSIILISIFVLVVIFHLLSL